MGTIILARYHLACCHTLRAVIPCVLSYHACYRIFRGIIPRVLSYLTGYRIMRDIIPCVLSYWSCYHPSRAIIPDVLPYFYTCVLSYLRTFILACNHTIMLVHSSPFHFYSSKPVHSTPVHFRPLQTIQHLFQHHPSTFSTPFQHLFSTCSAPSQHCFGTCSRPFPTLLPIFVQPYFQHVFNTFQYLGNPIPKGCQRLIRIGNACTGLLRIGTSSLSQQPATFLGVTPGSVSQ